MYLGTEKSKSGKKGASQVLFVRGISNSDMTSQNSGAERLLVMAMDELEYALLDSRVTGSVSSRLFLHMLSEFKSDPATLSKVGHGHPPTPLPIHFPTHLTRLLTAPPIATPCPSSPWPPSCCVSVQEWSGIMDRLLANYATRLLKLGVDEIEVKVRVQVEQEDGRYDRHQSQATRPLPAHPLPHCPSPTPSPLAHRLLLLNAPSLSCCASCSPAIQPVRLMASSMTGEFLRADAYVEYPDPITGMTKQFCSISRDEQICLMYVTSH